MAATTSETATEEDQHTESFSREDHEEQTPEDIDPWDLAVLHEREQQKRKHKIGLIVHDVYHVTAKIGFGSFGSIFVAENVRTRENAAVKFEIDHGNDSRSHLQFECRVYDTLRGSAGIPRLIWFGKEFGYNVLVMELLGPNLEQLLSFCDGTISLQTVLLLAEQMLHRLRRVHDLGFVHRDIKPANFLVGLGPRSPFIYLIDFGLTKRYRYRDEDGCLKHVTCRKGRNLVGTARYASVNAHLGMDLSRRDDLESLGYVLISLRLGQLPWQEVKAKTKEQRYKKIKNVKLNTSPEKLCSSLPREFSDYLRYCRSLGFDQEPDYDYLLNLFRNLLTRMRLNERAEMDWEVMWRRPEKRTSWEILFKWTVSDKPTNSN